MKRRSTSLSGHRQVCWPLCYLLILSSLLGCCLGARQLKQSFRGAATDLESYRRAGCDNFTSNTWQPLRPGYHITVPYGWMNDPHGMFQLNGTTHVFFQYNPKKIQWGAPFWGHVITRDLAHWTWLPPALLPDSKYDFNGVWSGAATVSDNQPYLTYTAAGTSVPELGNFFQQQALATPADPADPDLKQWVKSPNNPFISQVPPGGTNFQFRDPTEARHAVWLALSSSKNPQPLSQSGYALAVGTQTFCIGGAGIYSAPNMTSPWSYEGMLYTQLDYEPEVNGQCLSPIRANGMPGGLAYGGPCNQFGAQCRMWEVVDFLELEQGTNGEDSVWMIKWDDQSRFRPIFAMEWYVLGNGAFDYSALTPPVTRAQPIPKNQTFGAVYTTYPNTTRTSDPANRDNDYNYIDTSDESGTRSLFKGELDGQRFAPLLLDYGSIYASMVFRTEDMRQVLLSWIYETAAGCDGQCSDQFPEVVMRQGFKGVQTLPRQLGYDRSTKTLRIYPIAEIALLRGAQVVINDTAIPLSPQPTQLVAPSTVQSSTAGGNNTARQFELHVNFTLPAAGNSSQPAMTTESGASGPRPFTAGVRVLIGGRNYVDIFLRGSLSPAGGTSGNSSSGGGSTSYRVNDLSVWVDKSNAGPQSNTTWMEGGPIPLPVDRSLVLPQDQLGMSIWVDHTVIEVYAMGGLARVTSRVYPGDDSAGYRVSLWAQPAPGVELVGTAQMWEMNNMWLNPSCGSEHLV